MISRIYTLIDPTTLQDMYIGVTSARKLKHRYNGHIQERHTGSKKSQWINHLYELGLKPIMEQLDECDSDDAMFWEDFYINLYKSWGADLLNSHNSSYTKNFIASSKNPIVRKDGIKNSTKKPILQYNLDGTFVREWVSYTAIQKVFGKHHQTITGCCKGRAAHGKGFLWRYKTSNDYPLQIEPLIYKQKTTRVLQYDTDGNFIKEFINTNEAAKSAGLLRQCISYACSNKIKVSGGFMWRWKVGDSIAIKITPNKKSNGNKKTILMIDEHGKIKNEFESAREAGRRLNIDYKRISAAIKKNRLYNNYFWSFN